MNRMVMVSENDTTQRAAMPARKLERKQDLTGQEQHGASAYTNYAASMRGRPRDTSGSAEQRDIFAPPAQGAPRYQRRKTDRAQTRPTDSTAEVVSGAWITLRRAVIRAVSLPLSL